MHLIWDSHQLVDVAHTIGSSVFGANSLADNIPADNSGNVIMASSGSSNVGTASSNSRLEILREVTKLNDSLYTLYVPSGVPEVDVVFFHGMEKDHYEDGYWKTWCNEQGKLWPRTMLAEKFPLARILAVSYDSCLQETATSGRGDLYNIGENYVGDIIDIGTDPVGLGKRPVILVGHGLGGIVIQKFLVMAFKEMNKMDKNSKFEKPKIDKIDNFLSNVAGIFYYGTPHHGTKLGDKVGKLRGHSGPVLQYLKTLSGDRARLNEDFRKWRHKYETPAFSIAEKLPTDLSSWGVEFNDVVVEEGAVRSDTDGFLAIGKNHFDICKPTTKQDSSFVRLAQFVEESVYQKGCKVTVSKPVDTPSVEQKGSKVTMSQEGAVVDTPGVDQNRSNVTSETGALVDTPYVYPTGSKETKSLKSALVGYVEALTYCDDGYKILDPMHFSSVQSTASSTLEKRPVLRAL
ncbi:unnamed protein product [Calypogeia fissa]